MSKRINVLAALLLGSLLSVAPSRAEATCGTLNQACSIFAQCCTGNTCINGLCKINANQGWCTVDGDCVTGYVCDWGHCKIPTGSTKTCTAGTDCSSGNCNGTSHQCVCNTVNQNGCSRDGDCCSGNQCTGGYPNGACKISTNQGWCNQNSDCVNGECDLLDGPPNGHHCKNIPVTGNKCLSNADCYSYPGATECSGENGTIEGTCLGTTGWGCASTAVCLSGECKNLGNGTFECFPGSTGAPCDHPGDCGSSSCANGKCACSTSGWQCYETSDCCAGLTCNASPLWYTGTCQ
jgi:hypothetical protein